MTARTVNLWAHSQEDLDTLKGALGAVFGDKAATTDLGPHVWQNTGDQKEDTRVGYTKATLSDAQNPTLRFIAKAQVEGDASLSTKLAQVAALLPANNEDCFAFGNSINMGPRKLEVIQGGAETKVEERHAADG